MTLHCIIDSAVSTMIFFDYFTIFWWCSAVPILKPNGISSAYIHMIFFICNWSNFLYTEILLTFQVFRAKYFMDFIVFFTLSVLFAWVCSHFAKICWAEDFCYWLPVVLKTTLLILCFQAAAAMCVGMGSFSDPSKAQGLAHFLGMVTLSALG